VVAIYFVGDDMIFSFFSSLPWGRKINWEELGDDDDLSWRRGRRSKPAPVLLLLMYKRVGSG
jgi:hypothetical protein